METSAQHPPNRHPTHLHARPSWCDEFIRVRDWRADGREAEVRHLVRTGTLIPVARGVARWARFAQDAMARGEHPRDDAFRARVRGSMLVAPRGSVVSHRSAALLWGMSSLAEWPDRVTHTVRPGLSGQSTRWVQRHTHALDAVVHLDGMPTTTAARTIADVARLPDRVQAFGLAATGLHVPWRGRPLATLAEVRAELERLGSARGVRAARLVLERVGTGCASPAEATSLLLMLDEGFVRPEQQVEFTDERGVMVVDCWWPEVGLVGECDGLRKYLRGDRGDGVAASSAVVAEKLREDRLRALGLRVVRWTTETLRDARAFAALLATAGAPRASGVLDARMRVTG